MAVISVAGLMTTVVVEASTTATSVPTSPSPASATQGYRLVFSDLFRGGGVDGTKWGRCYSWGGPRGCTNPGNHEFEWYLPGQAQEGGGALHLVANRQPVQGTDPAGNPVMFPFASGMISTQSRFQFTYGYVEIRARAPGGQALWPALWMLPASDSTAAEIDILELIGQRPSNAELSFHWGPNASPLQSGVTVSGTNWTMDWHTYAVLWTPTAITWFIDGRQRWVVTHDVPAEPMYLLADLAVGGDWPGAPTASTPSAASFDISSVRVWQR
jgi:beta-glucanase (GH16 family)